MKKSQVLKFARQFHTGYKTVMRGLDWQGKEVWILIADRDSVVKTPVVVIVEKGKMRLSNCYEAEEYRKNCV